MSVYRAVLERLYQSLQYLSEDFISLMYTWAIQSLQRLFITWGHSTNVNLDPDKFNSKVWHHISTFLSCDGVGATLSGNQTKGFLWASRFRHFMNPWMKWIHGFHCKHTRVNYLFTDSLVPQLKILYWKPAQRVSGSQTYSGEQDKNGHCPQRQHSRGEGKAQTTNTWVIAEEKCSLAM